MGSALDLDAVYSAPHVHKVACTRCFYDNYNRVLLAARGIAHQEFI